MTVVRMGIRRSASSVEIEESLKSKTRHLIEQYKAYIQEVMCECGWVGHQDAFPGHRREVGASKESKRIRNKGVKGLEIA